MLRRSVENLALVKVDVKYLRAHISSRKRKFLSSYELGDLVKDYVITPTRLEIDERGGGVVDDVDYILVQYFVRKSSVDDRRRVKTIVKQLEAELKILKLHLLQNYWGIPDYRVAVIDSQQKERYLGPQKDKSH